MLNNRAVARLAVGVAGALLIAACGSADSASGPQAEVAVRVVDGAVAANPIANTATETTTPDSSEPSTDGSTTSESPVDPGPADPSPPVQLSAGDPGPVIEELRLSSEELTIQPDVVAAQFDVPNEGEIESLFGADRWSFTGTAGQLLTIDILSIDHDCRMDLDLYLVDPFEQRYDLGWIGNGGCRGQGPFRLDMDGEYGIEFRGGDGGVITDTKGGYTFVPSILTERDVNPVSFDVPNVGAIDQLFGTDRWTFTATAGQLLTLEVQSIGDSCRQDLTLFLVDPAGARTDEGWIGNSGCRGQGPFTLELDGEYAIEFSGGAGGVITSHTGPYRFLPTLS